MSSDKSAAEESEFVNRLAKEVNKDLENDNRPAIERHFEDLLDELHTSPSRSEAVGGPDAHEREDNERGIREFCNVMFRHADEALRSDSLKVRHVLAEEAGIVVTAEDGLKNSWQVTVSWEGLEKARLDFGEGPRFMSAIIGRVLFELRDARARWWRGRMPIKRTGRLH